MIDKKEPSQTQIINQPSKDTIKLKNAEIEIDNLKKEIHELEDYITTQSSKIDELTSSNEMLENKLNKKVGENG